MSLFLKREGCQSPRMGAGKSEKQSVSKKRRPTGYAMARWKAFLLLGVMLFLAGLLFWMGLAIVVRCERVRERRVDVTLERRFLGLLTLSREIVPDVIDADIYVVSGRTRGGGKKRRGSTEKLELTPRQGAVVFRSRFGPSIGAKTTEMAKQIDQFLQEPSRTPLTTWWMPWLVNVAAVLFAFFPVLALASALLQALGFFKEPSLPAEGNL